MILPIVDQFESILNNLNFKELVKKELLLREFLQSKIIEKIYQTKISKKIFFIGGTSLRLLHDLDRFSLDLDFDYQDIKKSQIEQLYNHIVKSLRQENIEIVEYKNIDKKPIEFEIRFPKILYELKLRQFPEENLVVKLDFDDFWKGHKSEVLVFNKFASLAKVITVSKNEILTQKLFALVNRKKTMARDIYDIVWLLSQGARIDWQFAKKNNLREDLIFKVRKKIDEEKPKFSFYKKQLAPLLIYPTYVEKIDFIHSYFPLFNEIKFERFEIIKSLDFDGYLLNFHFKAADKKVKFTYKVSETAMANPNFNLPKSEDDNNNIKIAVEKILNFYNKNPFKDYQIQLITTTNLLYVFDFDEILE
ncbi:MAG: nucleotidyl transferase AbiEii/AbiGii toxin family protein [Microgenomates group bacterium]